MADRGESPDRREVLRRAAWLAGGAAISQLPACSKSVEAPTAAAPATEFFSADEMRLITRIADLIIPETDTPGASGAGVPQKLDEMMAHWASEETQSRWRGVLMRIDRAAEETYGKSFLSLTPARQHVLLRMFDRDAMHTGGDDYHDVKELIVTAYYQSEVGATQELRFELIPGAYRGCVPLAEIGRAWA